VINILIALINTLIILIAR